MKVRYGVFFVSLTSDLCSASVTAVLYQILCHIESISITNLSIIIQIEISFCSYLNFNEVIIKKFAHDMAVMQLNCLGVAKISMQTDV